MHHKGFLILLNSLAMARSQSHYLQKNKMTQVRTQASLCQSFLWFHYLLLISNVFFVIVLILVCLWLCCGVSYIFVLLCFVFAHLLTCMMMWSSCIFLFLHSYSYRFVHNSYFYLLCSYLSLSILTFHFQLINFVLLLATLYSLWSFVFLLFIFNSYSLLPIMAFHTLFLTFCSCFFVLVHFQVLVPSHTPSFLFQT